MCAGKRRRSARKRGDGGVDAGEGKHGMRGHESGAGATRGGPPSVKLHIEGDHTVPADAFSNAVGHPASASPAASLMPDVID